MNHAPILIQVAQRQFLRRNLQMAETIDPLRIWPALRLFDLQLVKIRSAAA